MSNFSCNHRFARSTRYSDLTKVVALFDEPYLQVGSRERVEFAYSLENNFLVDGRPWNYDVSVDTAVLVFRLIVPGHFRAHVRLAQHVRPTDHEIQVLTPLSRDGMTIYEGVIENPEVGGKYAILWTPEKALFTSLRSSFF